MSSVVLERANQFEDSPHGWAQRWAVEIAAARKELSNWHASGDRIVDRYQDERHSSQEEADTRWNLFTANVQTQQALLYGKTPKVSVSRKFGDANDDVARVAGELLERLLNCDVERDGDTFTEALGYALQDRLLPGFGIVRLRYEATFEKPPAPSEGAGVLDSPTVEPRKTYEDVATDYVHWRDVLWSPARVWHEVRWVAFRAEMSREQVETRFGKEFVDAIPYRVTRKEEGEKLNDPWARAEVWEIWDKDSRRVFWWVEGYGQTLDSKDDPLSLSRFFPCPRPMLANAVTRKVVPRPDFVLAQDLYNEIDLLSTRITLLERAIAVRGVYDRSSTEVKRLLSEAGRNELIPVENWAMFAEKGGVKGVVDWLPLEQIVAALTVLSERREVTKAALFEITGMSDLIRGQAAAAGATATEQSIKARFASVRLQALQDDFARFATEVQRMKAEVIGRLYDDATIIERSNVLHTPDADMAAPAIALLRERMAHYRVEVKPEAVSMSDFSEMKSEGLEVIGALTQFVSAMAPMAQQLPGSMSYMLQLLQWCLARLKGSSEVEGILDRAIAQAEQAAAQQTQQPPPPDPKVVAQQMKGQQEMEKVQAETQARLVELQAEVQADQQREANQMQFNVAEARQKAAISAAFRPQAAPTGRER
jgi:hypothetical protein